MASVSRANQIKEDKVNFSTFVRLLSPNGRGLQGIYDIPAQNWFGTEGRSSLSVNEGPPGEGGGGLIGC